MAQLTFGFSCSGVDVPDCCLTYDIEKDELVLYLPEIHPERVIWTGRPPTIDEAKEM